MSNRFPPPIQLVIYHILLFLGKHITFVLPTLEMLICAAEIGIFSLNRNIKNSEENNWEEHLDLRALVNK